LENKKELTGFSIKLIKGSTVKAIKDAYAELNCTKKTVVSSLSNSSIIVRYIEIPSMTAEELKSATSFEAEKVIPYNIGDVVLDSVKLEDLSGNQMRAVIVAVKRELVEDRIRLLNEAELQPIILDISSFAIMNAFTNTGLDANSVCGLINIGDEISTLNIVKGNTSYLSRDIDIGGNDITKFMVSTMNISETEAKNIKQEKLFGLSKFPPEEVKGLKAALEATLSRLTDEIRLSLDFYETRYAGVVDKVYISGWYSRPNEVELFLKENLNANILRWDPLTNIDLAKGINVGALSDVKDHLAITVGLALRKTNL
jgi:type IV pilus assembly protein PilM